MSRRKNPHPQRAVNVKTVLKGENEERSVLLCLRIPDDDVDFDEVVEKQNEKMRKEKTATKRGEKRKRTQQHECDVCEKVFRYPSDLTRHMRTHANEKPYECDVCEKRFSQADTLQTHMRIHTNEKPYECDVCEKRYRHADSLKYHTRTQH